MPENDLPAAALTLERPFHSRVLLVDDEPVVRDVVLQLFSRDTDLVLVEVDSAHAALTLLEQQPFELLISDKNLPDYSGVALIERARALHPNLEAMLITGYANPQSVLDAFAAGASDYLLKPFEDLRTLRAKVRAALERRQERVSRSDRAQAFALEARRLLSMRDATHAEWNALDLALRRYEETVAEGAKKDVAVLGGSGALPALDAADFLAFACTEDEPALEKMEVAVVDTAASNWRALCELLLGKGTHVILWVSRPLELSEILKALELRVELVAADAAGRAGMPDRIRNTLRARSIRHGQKSLTAALDLFRTRLGAA